MSETDFKEPQCDDCILLHSKAAVRFDLGAPTWVAPAQRLSVSRLGGGEVYCLLVRRVGNAPLCFVCI